MASTPVSALPITDWANPAPGGWPVWGQDAAVARLRQAVRHDRVRHAFLVAGPDGVGKTTLAQALAQVLCCQDRPAPDLACGRCLTCRKIARGVHPDVQTFGLERQATMAETKTKNTTLTIESMRDLAATTALRPMEGRWRVIAVEDAETLQGPAQEALLKTLEEPPGFVVLLLLADDAELLLPTIRSRCQAIELRPANRPAVAAALAAHGTQPDRADEIAALANGRPGWAFRAAADAKLIKKREDAVERALAWIAGSAYDRLVTAVRLGDGFTKQRPETFADLGTLLGVWRDALLLRAALPHHLTYRGIAERLAELARGWNLDDLHQAVCAVQTCLADLESNVRPRLAMETMVLQWPINSNPSDSPSPRAAPPRPPR